jgi:very-short-patch-repair endonuclease
MKRQQISAEREFFIQIGQQDFALDFAIFCDKADIDIETDGDTYHANPQKGTSDNIRNNALEAAGWSVLRFNTKQINEQLEDYTLPRIVETINKQGGISEGKLLPRRIELNEDGAWQPGLFDNQ